MASPSSINTVLSEQADYLILVLGALLLFGALHSWLWRRSPMRGISLVMWALVAMVLGGGWFFVQDSARREGLLMRQMVEGYAPTFAREMERLRHEEITLKTSPDDPHYWQLV